MSSSIVHEEMYKKRNPISHIHSKRMDVITSTMIEYTPKQEITWADFGCSNGYLAQKLIKEDEFTWNEFVGFDHARDLLQKARKKSIPKSQFIDFDLNSGNDFGKKFNYVTCYETLEHVADYKKSFQVLYNHLKTPGILIVSVPNENNLVGLAKFFWRLVMRDNDYKSFLKGKSYFSYLKAIINDYSISNFRDETNIGYSTHLGFDYQKLEKYIYKDFVKENRLCIEEKKFTPLYTNVIYTFSK